MRAFLKKFVGSERGAITVDWVVLTAALAGLCIAFVAELKTASDELAANSNSAMDSRDPAKVVARNIQDLPTSVD